MSNTTYPSRPMTIATEPASVAAYLIQETGVKVCGWNRETVELADGRDIEVRVGVCVISDRKFRNLADLATYCTVSRWDYFPDAPVEPADDDRVYLDFELTKAERKSLNSRRRLA